MKMKKLIISEGQMRKLSEDATAPVVTATVDSGSTPENKYNEITAKTGSDSTVNIQPQNVKGDMAGTVANVNSKNMQTWDPAKQLWQRGATIQVNETVSFTKKDIRKMQKKNGEKFSKEDFKKKLDEEYMQFNKRLNEKRNNHGK